ncbi:kinase-like domain-containing protein [Tanacetum coccineum]|uniref:Kinase-like domain-containing protein n=1 Tax=Tanacetum coccineum TaxID=301880 RepID=A0ABQ4ZG02_9ASTR
MSFTGHPSFTEPPSLSSVPPRNWPKSAEILRDIVSIPLKDIIQATNNFADEKIIEKGYGWIVYKGELSGKKLAFVLVNERYIDTSHAFMLSSLPEHLNIVPFIGCCDMEGKMIFVIELPTRGSLDKYVTGEHLTWLMRVRICHDIASGLHHAETHEMAIKDLNISCVHIDENWQAKIQLIKCTMLSDIPQSFYDIIRRPYTDTLDEVVFARPYIEGGWRIRPLEIYYFGVILLELLCGRLAVTKDEDNQQFLNKLLASEHYVNGTLTEIVDPVLRVQMNRDSFNVFKELAYACMNMYEYKRPRISTIVEQLQKVLKLQQGFEISQHQQVSYCQFLHVVFLFY